MNTALSSPEPTTPHPHDSLVAAEFVYHDKSAPASARVVEHAGRDRAMRAARAWAGCWGAAIAAVFLPVLHFVLVPALLLSGPLAAMARWREKVTVLGAEGACPACGARQSPKLKAAAGEAMGFRCEACRRALVLKLPARLLAS